MSQIEVCASLLMVVDGETRTISTPRFVIDSGSRLTWDDIKAYIATMFDDLNRELARHASPESVLQHLPPDEGK